MSFQLSLEKIKDVKYLPLGDVCKICIGINIPWSLQGDSGLPIVKSENIRNGRIVTGNLNYCNRENYPDAEVIKYGDVVMIRKGRVGEVWINLTDREFFFNEKLFKFTANKDILSSRYLYCFFLSLSKRIPMHVVSGVKKIRKSDLERLLIPIPSLKDQEMIVKDLDRFCENRCREFCEGYFATTTHNELLLPELNLFLSI
ncbi:type I restriction enzyme specificity HsdS domain protein [Mycoplasma haemocanis str. Illinois]|uniref:Type I restriction enzyme specificity HsdS domain protein n=1 Tax=Mycoplasma haemocanis (strain Illinois) TaxID=1111676 RepID=H6N6Y6_MYCHN|nr:restriction endonuclease subunit S [Mycoplasma haemocanis]AEW45408.1 type I restriction enzyme specificity HsdS domain protein [Mycoplasma haemocanis str. Illinois]